MPNTLDLAYALLIAVAWPLYEYFVDWPAFQRRLRERPHSARVREYQLTIAWQWLLVVVGAVLWMRASRPWSTLALAPPAGWRVWASVGGLLLLATGYASQALKVARSERARDHLRKALASLDAILPHSGAEFSWFLAVSVTAGVCEEVLFRGYLIWTAAAWVGWWGAAALSALFFGLLHSYQGRKGIVRTAIVGVLMTLVVAGTGSLVPAMGLHALIDIGGGTVTWIALKDVEPASGQR